MKIALRVVVLSAFTMVLAWLSRSALLQATGDFLVRDDHPGVPTRDLILLMGDGSPARADIAISLYKKGLAQRVVFCEEERRGFAALGMSPSGEILHQNYLQRQGIPADATFVIHGQKATSTLDEARQIKRYLSEMPPQNPRIIVVTSWYHSRRAGWIFKEILAPLGIHVEVAPTPSEPEWWRHEGAFLSVFEEYLKGSYWLVRGFDDQAR